MGDHTHPAGSAMLSYRYMRMEMNGNRDGTDRLSATDVLADFMVTPLEMSMEMHMLGAMWAPSDRVTLMVMQPYAAIEMDHRNRMGATFTTASSGLGDLKVAALINLFGCCGQHVHLHAGIGVPTGSIDETGDTPMGHVRLPYPMQLGSGTFDLYPGVTYHGKTDSLSWGGQVLGTIRLVENDNDYRLGDRVNATAWGGYRCGRSWTTSLRLNVARWGNIDGADPELAPAMVPTADPDRRGGTRADLGLGAAFATQNGLLAGQRFAVEYSRPLYQDLDGPQLETDEILTLGWQGVW
jgi:hypothetical protein